MSNNNRNKKHFNDICYYTDGSMMNSESGRKFASFGFIKVLKSKIVKEFLSPIENHAYINRMELKAIIFACKDALETYGENPSKEIYIFTDSAYVANSVNNRDYEKWLTNGWKNARKKPVAHKKYWEQLIPFLQNKKIHICKVRGHSSITMNTFIHNAVQNATILAAHTSEHKA